MNPFEVLGLPNNANKTQVKAAWRQLASTHHPDRGGDGETFDRMHKAYETALAEAPNCSGCNDAGYVVLTVGISSMKVLCQVCGGAQ